MSEVEKSQEKEIDSLINMQTGSLNRMVNIVIRLRRLQEELLGSNSQTCGEAQDNPVPECRGPHLVSVSSAIQQQITEIEDLMDSIERFA